MRDMKIHEEKPGDDGWTMSLDLAAAYGGWWREIGTTIERATSTFPGLFRSSFQSHATSPA